jgi:hypothetical protein
MTLAQSRKGFESLKLHHFMEYSKTNREKSLTAKKEKFWCRCDSNHIGQYGKCAVCGRINYKRKLKKY